MLNISKQIYAGHDNNSQGELPEAEIMPLGTSSNEKKKFARFSKQYHILAEHDNIPLPGFTLMSVSKQRYSSAEQTWTIIDPRGFLVRITSENLNMILHVTGITEGLIQEKCVWAREDSSTKMTLVPISSEKYIEAVENTELLESKIEQKAVQRGDKVLLQNKMTGIYYGHATLYGPVIETHSGPTCKPIVQGKRGLVETSPGIFYHKTDLRILKVIEPAKTELTKDEVSDYINSKIDTVRFTSTGHISPTYTPTHDRVFFVSLDSKLEVDIVFEEIQKDEAKILLEAAYVSSDIGKLCLEINGGGRFLVDTPYYSPNTPSKLVKFNAVQITNVIAPCKQLVLKEIRSFWSQTLKTAYSLDNFDKFYKIVKRVKNKSYV